MQNMQMRMLRKNADVDSEVHVFLIFIFHLQWASSSYASEGTVFSCGRLVLHLLLIVCSTCCGLLWFHPFWIGDLFHHLMLVFTSTCRGLSWSNPPHTPLRLSVPEQYTFWISPKKSQKVLRGGSHQNGFPEATPHLRRLAFVLSAGSSNRIP